MNPYSPENSPPFFYLYGFLFSLIVSPLTRLPGLNAVLLHKLVTLLCVLGASWLVSLEVRRNTGSLLLQALGFALMLTSSWNGVPFIIRPDSFGLLLILLIPFLLRRNNSFLAVAVSALLTIASFYTKQYFLFVAAPVFVHELREDWRKAVCYVAVSLLAGAGSFFLVRSVFPGFFSASLVAQANSVGGPIRHLLLQSLAFASRAWPLLLLMCYPLGRRIFPRIAGRSGGNGAPGLRIYYLIFLVAVVCLLFLGTNTGAWLSYFYQLALPSLIIISLSMLAKLERLRWRAAFLLLLAVNTLFFAADKIRMRSLDFFPAAPGLDEASWARAHALLDQNRSSQMMLAPIFADYICRNGIEPVDNGNTEYYGNLRITEQTVTMKVLSLLLPDSDDQFDRYAAWRTRISENVRAKRYSIIAVLKQHHPLADGNELAEHYLQIEELQLPRTVEQAWAVAFWVPKR